MDGWEEKGEGGGLHCLAFFGVRKGWHLWSSVGVGGLVGYQWRFSWLLLCPCRDEECILSMWTGTLETLVAVELSIKYLASASDKRTTEEGVRLITMMLSRILLSIISNLSMSRTPNRPAISWHQ
jgi:hypothetical protein